MTTLLIIIGAAIFISLVGYHILLRLSKTRNKYWFRSGDRNSPITKIEREFTHKDRQMKIYKEIISISIHCRNLSNQLLNEISGLVQQKVSFQPIQEFDLLVLQRLGSEFEKEHEKLSAIQAKRKELLNPELDEFFSTLKDVIIAMNEVIHSNIQLGDQSNMLTALSKNNHKTHSLNQQLIDLHESIVNNFQSNFIDSRDK